MSSVLTTRAFWEASAERAVKSVAQGALAGGITTAALTDGHLLLGIVLTGVATGLASLLTSIASINLGSGNGPSLTAAEQLVGPDAPPVDPAVP